MVVSVVPFVPEFDVATHAWRCRPGIKTYIEPRERCSEKRLGPPIGCHTGDRQVRADQRKPKDDAEHTSSKPATAHARISGATPLYRG